MADSEKKHENMSALAASAPRIVDNERILSDERTAVLDALENPRYLWRTAEGIAVETDLLLASVRRVLVSESNSLIVSAIPDDHGKTRYTTLRHYRAHAGILRRVLDTLSDQVR